MKQTLGLLLVLLSVSAGSLYGQLRPLPTAADLPKLREAAKQGDAVALYQLGICYIEEIGVGMDYVEGCEYLEKAAAKGDAPAMAMLSYCYMGSPGIPRDKIKVHEWSKRAFDTGHPAGMLAMSQCYAAGIGGEKSLDKAMRLTRKAAETGDPAAMASLAIVYLVGDATFQNHEEGVRLAKLAAERGNRNGDYALGAAYHLGRGVEIDIELAREHLKRAMKNGSISALGALGNLEVMSGDPDYVGLVKILGKGVRHQEPVSCCIMGYIYLNGHGTVKDTVQAARLLRIAAGRGNTEAFKMLGRMTYSGQGCPVDECLGYAFMITGAELGSSEAQEVLNGTPPATKQGPVFQKAIAISQSIKAQLSAADIPVEISEGYSSNNFQEGSNQGVSPGGKGQVFTGTGMVFTPDGHCFTNHHVVEGASRIKVYIPSSKETLPAKLVSSDSSNDIAIVKIEGWKPAPGAPASPPQIVSSTKAKIGDKAFTIGFPLSSTLGQEPKYTSGDISAGSGINDDRRVFQITTPLQPGNSGGPLVLADGRVVGIVCSGLSFRYTLAKDRTLPQNVNFAVKSDYLRILAASSGVDIPEDGKPATDPIEHTKAYIVQVICER